MNVPDCQNLRTLPVLFPFI